MYTIHVHHVLTTLFNSVGVVNFVIMARQSEKESQRKKELAKLLYLADNLSPKEIAEQVGITEKTLRKWIEEEMWKYLKQSLLTTKNEQLRRYYAILNAVTDKIENTEGGYGDPKLADMAIKYGTVIKNIENEASVGFIFQTCILLTRFVQKQNLKDAKMIVEYLDAFVNDQLSHKF